MPTAGRTGRLTTTWRLLAKELSAFGVVGAACFVLDLSLFQVLYANLGVGAVTAKLVSTVVSMSVAFVAHRYWSFSHRARTGVRREYLLFAVVNGLTLLISLAAVALVRYPLGQDDPLVLQLASVCAIGVGTVIRFLAYRRWVFVARAHPSPVDPLLDPYPDPAPDSTRPVGDTVRAPAGHREPASGRSRRRRRVSLSRPAGTRPGR